MTKRVADYFDEFFEMVPARTPELKETSYSLRYQVFCEEMGYWNPELYPEGLECDEHDPYADHFLIRHRRTGIYAATTRLILPNPADPEWRFSIEKHAPIDESNILNGVPRDKIAEASRFCVSMHFKRREGERHTLAGVGEPAPSAYHPLGDEDHRQMLPNFTLPLLACLVRMSVEHGITHWYAFMEPSFARLFKALGIHFIPVGPLIDYCGKRRAYAINVADLLSGAKEKDLDAWDLLTNYGRFWNDAPPQSSGTVQPLMPPP